MITIHRNTINPFAVFKSSLDLLQVEENNIFLAKITYDITQVSKVVALSFEEKTRYLFFEFEEGVEDLPNGIIELPSLGHYTFDLYTAGAYTSDVSELTKLYTEKMKLV